MKQYKNIVRVDSLDQNDSEVGKLVVVEERKRITSISDMIVNSDNPKYEAVQVPGKIIGGSTTTYEVVTEQRWPRRPLTTTIAVVTFAVKKQDGKVLLVDEHNLVQVYDESIWATDSSSPEEEKAKKPRKIQVTKKATKL